jgi:hypothetical protein
MKDGDNQEFQWKPVEVIVYDHGKPEEGWMIYPVL